MRFTPSPHPHDRDALLTAVTARAPLQLVIDNVPARLLTDEARELRGLDRCKRPIPECLLDMREAERDKDWHLDVPAYLAAISRKHGLVDVRSEQETERCQWCPGTAECIHPRCLEMACAAPSAPSVPTRRNRRLPTLPWWKRLLLAMLPRSTR